MYRKEKYNKQCKVLENMGSKDKGGEGKGEDEHSDK